MAAALDRSKTVAVIGAGTMGAGIAQIAAQYGHRVQLHDMRFGAADAAKRGIGEALQRQVAKGKFAATDAEALLARIETVVTVPDCTSAALVIEAIVEDLPAKRELFARLENIVSPECILATNTSSLSVTAIAAGLKHPGRVAGMHFFNPVPLMPLVEIVSGLATGQDAADVLYATAAAWGKTPVRAQSTPGFIVNRVARPYYGEALRLVHERVADPATIDAVMREAGGFRMGPFELIDLIGLDVNFAVSQSVWNAYFHDPRFTPALLQQEMVAAGRLGRKSGRGFYDYAEGASKPQPATEPAQAKPAKAIVLGDPGPALPLVERLRSAGVAIEAQGADAAFPAGALQTGTAMLALTDGRSATARAVATGAHDLVLFDLALDYATAKRLAVARADQCSDAAYAGAVGLLQAAGLAVSRFDDVPALAVMRTVAMLANEAADAVNQGVCDAAAVDTAMRLGVNYPRGPLAWADAIGVERVFDVLANLAEGYGEDRYRISPLLRRHCLTGGKLG